MRRIVLLLYVLAMLGLAGCAQEPPVKCEGNAFAKDIAQCQSKVTDVAVTALPTEVVATPTPAAVQPQSYKDLVDVVTAYGVQIEGLNPNSTDTYTGTLHAEYQITANVVGLNVPKFELSTDKTVLLVILKMDDADYEQSKNYSCQKIGADDLAKTDSGLVVENGSIKNLFFPGSTDKYVYLCGGLSDFIKGYSGWAEFSVYDPAKKPHVTANGQDLTPLPTVGPPSLPTATGNP